MNPVPKAGVSANTAPGDGKRSLRSSTSSISRGQVTADSALDLLRNEPTTAEALVRNGRYPQGSADSGSEPLDLLDHAGGVFKGAGEVAIETASGLLSLASAAIKTGYDLALDPVADGAEWIAEEVAGEDLQRPPWLADADRGWDRISTGAEAIGALASNPGMIIDAAVDPIAGKWDQGLYGESIGRGFAEVAGVVVGAKGAGTLLNKMSTTGIPKHAYRGDIRNPEVILKKGFEPWKGTDEVSLRDHVNGARSSYVSTSKSYKVAEQYAIEHHGPTGYIYKVKVENGINVNRKPGFIFSPHMLDKEIVIHGRIKPENIVEIIQVKKNGRTVHEKIPIDSVRGSNKVSGG